MVAAILAETGLPPNTLDLEITESVLTKSSEENIGALHRLADMGGRLSVDDFGTGYSSLSYLKCFPIYASERRPGGALHTPESARYWSDRR